MLFKSLLVCMLLNFATAYQTYASQKVLLLNSYHPQYKWTSELTKGVRDAISHDIQKEDLYIEYMDTRRFMDDSVYNKKLL